MIGLDSGVALGEAWTRLPGLGVMGNLDPCVLLADPRQGLVVATADGALLLTEVQPAGKPPMEGSAFVRGYPIQAGDHLGR